VVSIVGNLLGGVPSVASYLHISHNVKIQLCAYHLHLHIMCTYMTVGVKSEQATKIARYARSTALRPRMPMMPAYLSANIQKSGTERKRAPKGAPQNLYPVKKNQVGSPLTTTKQVCVRRTGYLAVAIDGNRKRLDLDEHKGRTE
jgi:hypothetical protein